MQCRPVLKKCKQPPRGWRSIASDKRSGDSFHYPRPFFNEHVKAKRAAQGRPSSQNQQAAVTAPERLEVTAICPASASLRKSESDTPSFRLRRRSELGPTAGSRGV